MKLYESHTEENLLISIHILEAASKAILSTKALALVEKIFNDEFLSKIDYSKTKEFTKIFNMAIVLKRQSLLFL